MKRFLSVIYIHFISILLTLGACGQENSFTEQRKSMVKYQIEERGILNQQVLSAFWKVERHRFVPPEYVSVAYIDSPLPIEEGQTISQPFIVAFMTEALNLKPGEKVLEVGTGSGYQAAILAELCAEVYSVEIFGSLALKASTLLDELGYRNIFIKTGDGYKGWPEKAPFDAIIVTCSPTHIPDELIDQLAEGGRMIIPVGENFTQQLVLLTKKNGKVREKRVLPVRFVPMIDSQGKKY